MPIVNPPVIPPAPPAPQRNDPDTFEERNDAAVEYQFNTLPPALNAISQATYDNAVTAMNAAQQSQGNANFKGLWSSLTGPLEIPASVYHNGDYWNLLVDLADVTTSEPSASNSDWAVSVVRLVDSFEIGDFRSSLVELDDNYLRRDGAIYPISSYPDLAALLPSYPSDFEWSAQNIGTSQDVRAIIRLSEFELIAVASTIPSSDATDILYSPNNGASWELRATIADIQATAIVRNPDDGTLIIGGASRKYSISLNDGVSWSTPANLPSLHSSAVVMGMIHFNGAYFAIGAGDRSQTSHVLRSTNGSAWASVYTIPQANTSDRGQGMALFAGADRVYVSFGAAGIIGFAMSNSAGTTFTRQEVGGSQSNFPLGGVFTGDAVVAQFFLGAPSTTLNIFGTTNGSDWTERASIPGAASTSVRSVVPVFANNVLVLNTDAGTVAVSNADAAEFDIQALPDGFSVTVFGSGERTYGRPEISNDGSTVLFPGEGGMVARGIAVPAGQFRVPDDAPLDGWVKAKNTPIEDASQVVIKNLPTIIAAPTHASAAANSAAQALAYRNDAAASAASAAAIVWDGATGLPKIRPTLNLDFANGRYMDPRVSFTRASAATYFDAMGVLRTAAAGEPRFDYGPVTGESLGLLVEGQATNLLLGSDSPATQTVVVTDTAMTLSFIGTGTITLSGAYTGALAGTGDERVTLTFTPSAGSLTLTVSGNVEFAQLEEGTHPTSYTPTEGSQVTRAADNTSIPAGDWFNPVEGTLVIKAELSSLQTANFGRIFELSDATQDNRILVMSNDSGGIRLQTFVNGVDASSPYTTLSNPKLSVAVSWGAGAARWAINGNVRQVVNQSPVITNMPTMTLLASQSFSNRINGAVERITYYPRALSDAELQALTS